MQGLYQHVVETLLKRKKNNTFESEISGMLILLSVI
jgi:hypothetical protein